MSRSTEHTVLFESVLSSRSGVNETCPLICANFIFNFKLYTLRVDLRHHVLRNCMCFQFEIWPFSVRISSILPLEFQSQFFASGQRRFVSPLPCRFDQGLLHELTHTHTHTYTESIRTIAHLKRFQHRHTATQRHGHMNTQS